MCVCVYSVTKLYTTAYDPIDCSQAPLSMGLSRQEYWSGLTFPPSGDPPDPGIKPMSPVMADSFPLEPPGEPNRYTFPKFIRSHGELLRVHITQLLLKMANVIMPCAEM